MDVQKPKLVVKRSRASMPKVKTGCKTCKKRGVKCGEEKPVCRRCISGSLVCDGYGIWGGGGNAYGSVDRAARLKSSTPLTTLTFFSPICIVSEKEKMAFDYFRTRTSIKLPGLFDSGFWETLVFQASSKEPAVLHALIALGATHLSKAAQENHRYSTETSQINQYEHLALQQYNKAIDNLGVHFDRKDKDSRRIALITCMVFICVELLRERFKTANAHLNNGLRLLSEIQGRGWSSSASNFLVVKPEPGVIDDYLIEAFTRLNIHSALFGRALSFLYIVDQDTTCGPEYKIPQVFETFRQARLYLDGLMNRVYYLSQEVDEHFRKYHHIPEKFIRRKEDLQVSSVLWLKTLDACLPSFTTQGNYSTALGVSLLRIYHSMTTIMVSTCIQPGNEMVYDVHTSGFISILTQSADLWKLVVRDYHLPEPGLTIDMGVVPPLYYTALKCRVPGIRREAINLLLSAPHREGLWDGVLAACIARHIMEIEEGDFYQDISIRNDLDPNTVSGSVFTDDMASVPQFSRVHNVSVLLPDGIYDKAELMYSCFDAAGEGSCKSKTAEMDITFGRVASGDFNGCVLTNRRDGHGR